MLNKKIRPSVGGAGPKQIEFKHHTNIRSSLIATKIQARRRDARPQLEGWAS
jgi:hypothetical protein